MNWRATAYSFVYALAIPFIVIRLIWRGHSQRLLERFGLFKTPKNLTGCIWVHCVSVGETIAAVPMIKALQVRHPDKSICVTTTTATGSARVQNIFGDSVFHVYNPYDLGFLVDLFLAKIKPELCIIMETELWPNMLSRCHANKIPVLIANARLSEKSAKGYARFAHMTRQMLSNICHIAVQNDTDGKRFLELGIAPEKLTSTGSIKFDISLTDEILEHAKKLKQTLSNNAERPIWIAASTHQGEDDIILAAHKQLLAQHPQARLILVPRHPERFEYVAKLVSQQGFSMCKRSQGIPTDEWQVMVGDTMGELLTLLGCADIAFIGGSLVPNGGHNMLEAAIWACPVITGPHLFNFQEISNMMIAEQAMVVKDSSSAIADTLSAWLSDPAERHRIGDNGLKIVVANRGSLDKLMAIADKLLVDVAG